MGQSIQNVAYYTLLFALAITIPQIISLAKNKNYLFVSYSTLYLNIFVFGVFTLYAISFKDYLLASFYGATLLANFYILHLKYSSKLWLIF